MTKLQTTITLLLFALMALAVVVLCVMNQQPVIIKLPGCTATLPEGALVLKGVILGGVATACLLKILTGNPAVEAKRLSNWQAQDAKLVAQIKSDREKQLEAKIATLEAALKASLTKS